MRDCSVEVVISEFVRTKKKKRRSKGKEWSQCE